MQNSASIQTVVFYLLYKHTAGSFLFISFFTFLSTIPRTITAVTVTSATVVSAWYVQRKQGPATTQAKVRARY